MKTWKTKSGYRIIRLLSGRSNVFLLTSNEKNILIDTSPKFMWRALEKRFCKLNIEKIEYLILTHSHFDHVNNALRIRERFNAQILIHVNESAYLSSGRNTMIEGTNAFMRMMTRLLAKGFLSRIGSEPCIPDIIISEDIYSLKDTGFNAFIMHTPGHTSGSVSVIIDDEIALVGDTMFGIFPWSVFPPFADNIKQMIHSWGKLLETNCRIFIPSHGSANPRSLLEKDYKRKIGKYK